MRIWNLAPATASLATNVILPAQADAIIVDGAKVAVNQPFERVLKHDTVVGIREGRTGVAIRFVHADAAQEQAPDYRLKADAAGLKLGAARLIVYHYNGPEKKLEDKHIKVGVLILAGRCEGNAAFAELLKQAREAAIEQTADASAWKVSARVGGRTLEAARDLKKPRPLYQRVDGQETTRPVFSVNGEDWAAKIWK
jgi:hypothetical protein